jgi:hypothetical protein
MFKHICSRCNFPISKKDEKINDYYPFGKLLCLDCLIKVGDFQLPIEIKHSKLFRLLGGTDEEFENELIKSENKLKELGKVKSKYEFH